MRSIGNGPNRFAERVVKIMRRVRELGFELIMLCAYVRIGPICGRPFSFRENVDLTFLEFGWHAPIFSLGF